MAQVPEAYIYEAIRTPRGRGKPSGALHEVKPISLVVGLIHELRRRFPALDPAAVDDVVLGVVTPLGDQGGVIARAAALAAGLPETVAGLQLDRFCASGLEAVNVAAMKVRSGSIGICAPTSATSWRMNDTSSAGQGAVAGYPLGFTVGSM